MKKSFFNKILLKIFYCLSFIVIGMEIGFLVTSDKVEASPVPTAEAETQILALKEIKASGEQVYVLTSASELVQIEKSIAERTQAEGIEETIAEETQAEDMEEVIAEEELTAKEPEIATMKGLALSEEQVDLISRRMVELVVEDFGPIPGAECVKEPVEQGALLADASFEEAIQPTTTLSIRSTKVLLQYAGSIDYDAILQGPVIYDFGPEGIHALECVVWHEARGEPFDGQVAVAASAINRLYSNCPWFDDKSSIIGVLSEPYQFAYLEVSDADLATCPNVSRAVQAAIRGADPTVCEAFPDGAMWYYNPEGTSETFPEADYELVIGHHHFHNYGYKWKQ